MAPAAIESLGSGMWHSPMQSSSSAAAGTAVLVTTAAAVGVAVLFGEEAIVVGASVDSTFVVGTGKDWHAVANVTATIMISNERIL